MEWETVAFSDFTFDITSGDLTRSGKKLRIPRQTSRLLTVLLERAGTVVTREELQEVLWPGGAFLDHAHAINRTVNHLRMVLRDNSRKPKFIETIHKRGYRFLAEVTVLTAAPPRHGRSVASEGRPAISRPEVSVERSPEISLESRRTALAPVEPSSPPASVSLATAEEVDPAPFVLPEISLDASPAGEDLIPPSKQPGRLAWLFSGRRRAVLVAATVLVIAAAAAFAVRAVQHHGQPRLGIIYLGIAPLQTEGDGADQLAESFRLDLADALSQLPVVQIRATNSLARVGRDDASIRQVADALHLDMLLFGRITVHDNRCTVQFELVRGHDTVHLASLQYSGSRDELAAIRDKVQRDVFLNLQGVDRPVQTIRGSTQNPQAYSYYLQARELTRRRDPQAVATALEQYRLAIDHDPNFAQAYAGMATAHLGLRYFGDVEEHQRQARLFAEQALRLDSGLAEAHAALGDIAFRQDWNYSQAESELRKAVELEPHKSVYHAWLGGLLANQGRFDEGSRQMDLAISDDPLWPSVYSMASFVAGASRDNAKMIQFVQKYVQLQPDSAYGHDQLAWAYFAARRYEDAIGEWRRMALMEKDERRVALEDRGLEAYRRGGVAAYARTRVDAIAHGTVNLKLHPNDFVAAEWYAVAGDREKALAALDQIVAQHDTEAITLAVNSMFDDLHHDPHFLALLGRVGLTLPTSYPNRNTLRADRAELNTPQRGT